VAEPSKHVILGTAGHIDHGKTALVKALTGIDTDRLPEERARGISIELGFARLDLPSGASGVTQNLADKGKYMASESTVYRVLKEAGWIKPKVERTFPAGAEYTSKTSRVNVASDDGTQANKFSHLLSISADGRFVGFFSDATNLVPNLPPRKGYTNVFVRDCLHGTTTLVSVAPDGTTPGNEASRYPMLNADGSLVLFQSLASNLVASDARPNSWDLFLRDMTTGQTAIVSVSSDGTQANGSYTSDGRISSDGRYVGFTTDASNLPGGGNGIRQVYVRDLGERPFAISSILALSLSLAARPVSSMRTLPTRGRPSRLVFTEM
jgi:hypothetical protein